MKRKIGGIFGLLLLSMVMLFVPGGVVKAGEVEENEECEHKYGDPKYNWEDGYSSATLVLTCQNCGDTKKHDLNITSEVTEEATCTKKGIKKYTGSVEINGTKYENSKEIEIEVDPNNHNYGDPEYVWEPDGSSAKAVLTCERDSTHIKEYKLTITSEVTKEATCTETGIKKYTGSVEIDGTKYESSKEIETEVDQNNHDYKVVFNWASDYSSATVEQICNNNTEHKLTPEATVTVTKAIKEATCISNGETTYTASVTIDGKTYTDTKVITSAKNPQNHVGGTKIANAKKATCTAAGYTGDTVCASCGLKLKTGSEIKALGYKWDTGKVTKKATSTAEGVFTYTCTNGCGHTKTEIIPRTSVTVELGKKANIISKASACQKMSLASASKYKKYLTFNTKTGVITTKKYYKVKINKSIPVKLTIGGKTYTVKIKIKIPAPKIKVTKKKVGNKGYKYTFKYNIKGASKIKVRMQKGGNNSINKEFDRDISKPKSGKNSYMLYSKKTMKKLKNKITFKVIAYYGKNQSETFTITK